MQIASRFLFLSMAIQSLELDRKQIEYGNIKIKEPYIEKIEEMTSKAVKERRELRSTMYKDRIQIHLLNREASFTTYQYILGKNEMEIPFNNMVIRQNVEKILLKLLQYISKVPKCLSPVP